MGLNIQSGAFLAMVIEDEEIALDPICAFDIYFPKYSCSSLLVTVTVVALSGTFISSSTFVCRILTNQHLVLQWHLQLRHPRDWPSEPSAAKRPLPAFQSKFSSKQFDLLQFHKQLDSAALWGPESWKYSSVRLDGDKEIQVSFLFLVKPGRFVFPERCGIIAATRRDRL